MTITEKEKKTGKYRTKCLVDDTHGIPIYIKDIGNKSILMCCRGKYIEWSL